MDKKTIEEAIGQEIPEELYEHAVTEARKKLQSIIHVLAIATALDGHRAI